MDVSRRHYRGNFSLTGQGGDDFPITFNASELFSSVKVGNQSIFAENSRKNATTVIERNTSARIDWLDSLRRLKGGMVCGFVGHGCCCVAMAATGRVDRHVSCDFDLYRRRFSCLQNFWAAGI
jgi:hypothetical protein